MAAHLFTEHFLTDGRRLFVNYLNVAFERFYDGPIDHDLLAEHSKEVGRNLQEYESDERVLPKYTWIAAYHDYVCRTFADEYSIRGCEEADPYNLAIEAEARRALELLVHLEAQPGGPPPRPLDAKRLRQRLATT